MGTRLKRWKAAGSALALVLGLCLLAGGLVPLGAFFRFAAESGADPRESFQPDCQQTADFRNLISTYFETFVTMAVGGPLTGGWIDQYALLEAAELSEDAADGTAQAEMAEVYPSYTAEELDGFYRDDVNLLYQISRDGVLLYSNSGDPLPEDPSGLPQGYNFLLRYDGEKARVWKDGRELDIYGDGTYREGNDWYLPGYENFTLGEAEQGVSIAMAVREEPVPVITGLYFESGGSYQLQSVFYQLFQLHGACYRQLMLACLLGAGGLVLLGLSLAACRGRKEALAGYRAVSGRVPLEIKLLLFGAWLAATALLGSGGGTGAALRFSDNIFSWEELLPVQLYESVPAALSAVLLAFAAVLELSGGPWKNSLTARLFRIFRKKGITLPFSVRMRRELIIFFVSELLLAVCAAWLAFSELLSNEPLLALTAWGGAAALLVMMSVTAAFFLRHCMKVLREMEQIASRIDRIHSGDFSGGPVLPEDAVLAAAGKKLEEIQSGMDAAIEARIKSERMKVELITNVSHDIKTPLTSIVSYTALLREEELPPQAKDYAEVLCRKAQRLQSMVQDVFDISRAASGQLPVHLETLDLAMLLRQTLTDMAEPIEQSAVTLKPDIPTGPVPIVADGQRLYRVFQNLVQNALQYSLEGSRVYLTLRCTEEEACVTVKNTSRTELPDGVDFTERFVRGDRSRSDGGSGLGLSIARSFAEACGGTLQVETDADRFTVTVRFPTGGNSPRE